MSKVKYDAGTMTIEVDGLEDVRRALGELGSKTPAVTKVAINATARQARKLMIARARARYAVNAAGQRHLGDLVQRKKATNASLSAELHIKSFRNDLGYFEHTPTQAYTGRAVFYRSPAFYRAHVLKSTSLRDLTGTGRLSKGFLMEFRNATGNSHIGMVQRVIGSQSKNTRTRSGAPRWRNGQGKVEKLVTMGSPSAAAMHNTIWPEVRPEVEAYLLESLMERTERVLARAVGRT